MLPATLLHLASNGTSAATGGSGQTGADSYLMTLNINTTAASSNVTLYDHGGAGTSTANSKLFATIDCSSTSSRALDFGGAKIAGGFVAYMQGGNADVSITYV